MNGDNLVGGMLNDRYEIIEKIGAGGMATVYKAKDILLNRNVAIKMLRDSLEEEEQVVNNFVKEAQSSAGLAHNNIVSVYDVGEDNGLNYIVMELVEGTTLKQYIKEKGTLPWQEACDYAIQICQGLNEAHSKDIIHCDIKPQNIIITEDKTAKVTDFGIAKAVSGGTTLVGGSALGSVHYISPEQARGGYTDPRSDIYSLGIVIYEMLSGRVPFDGDSAVGIAMKHLEEDAISVKCINLDIPTDLDYVVMKAISKEQLNRYQTMQEMLNDLHAVLASEPLPSCYNETVEEEVTVKTDNDEVTDEQFDDIELITKVPDEAKQRERRVRTSEQEKKKKAQKKANRLATLMAILTIILVGLLSFGIYSLVNNVLLNVSVPDFTNMTVDEARRLAEKKSLLISDEDIEYSISDTVEEGKVVTQTPLKGTLVEKKSNVKIVISIGARGGDIAVPDLLNKTRTEALELINERGLKVTVIEETSKTVPAGNVIRQTPIAGTKLFSDDYVTIYVSKGINGELDENKKDMREVPYILGIDMESARNKLTEAGLILGSVSISTSNEAEGTIISQSVASGTDVVAGSSVSIVISGGPDAPPTQEPQPESPTNEPSGSNGGHTASGTRTFFVSIPSDAESDDVYVEVYVNGVLVHEGTYSKDIGSVPVDISGSGSVNVTAYVDGVAQSQTIDFNN